MAFIDELKIYAKAGKGGNGVVRWRHEKNREYGGPSGGDGGKGGDVYAKAIRDVSALSRYRAIKEFRAKNGEAGKSKEMKGANAENLIIEMPIGSVVTNLETSETFELLEENQQVMLLTGGTGGLGNARFKGSYHQSPEEWTAGKKGESAHFYIELRLIADAGFIGLPNAGKSSLLNVLTRANVKVGSYAFTTLEPNLGVMNSFVLADIPGLIEGASEGKGLGHKFLRHIRRTKALFHAIPLDEPDILSSYETVRKELGQYDKEMLDKPEVIILTKSDLVGNDRVKEARKLLGKRSKHVFDVSVYDDKSVKELKEKLSSLLEGKK